MMQQAQIPSKPKTAKPTQEDPTLKVVPAKPKTAQQTQEEQLLTSLAIYLALIRQGKTRMAEDITPLAPEAKTKKIEAARKALNCASDLAVCIEPKGDEEKTKYSTILKMFEMISSNAGEDLSRVHSYAFVKRLLTMALRDAEGDFAYLPDDMALATINSELVNIAMGDSKIKEDVKAIRASIEKPTEFQKPQTPAELPAPSKGFVPLATAKVAEIPLSEAPEYVKNNSVKELIEQFEKAPSDVKLEMIAMRLQYLREQRSVAGTSIKAEDQAKVAEIDAEITRLQKWLTAIGLMKAGESVDQGLTGLHAEFVAIQTFYYSMDEQKQLINVLRGASKNDAFFSIVKKYLSGLDANSLKMFTDIRPQHYNYLGMVEARIDQFLLTSDYKRAKAQWFTDYYSAFNPAGDAIGSPITSAAFQKIAEIDPVLAEKFAKYLKKISENGLGSPQEKAQIVGTVIKLYALNPILVGKYFDAITNIADICEDNVVMYRDSLARISARLSAEADSAVGASSPAQILPMNIRRVVTNIGNSLDEIAAINKAALSRFNRLDLWDENIYRNPNPPHEIWQLPPAYIPNLNVNEPYPGTMGIPYPFTNQRFPAIGMPMSGGYLNVGETNYGGSMAFPMINPLNINGGSLAQAMAMKWYLDPQHPFIAISKYLPGVNISLISPSDLLMEIDKAFIPTAPPDYSGKIIKGGGAAGVMGRKAGDEWEVGGGGLGSFITPSGGWAFGGYGSEGRVMAGATAIGIPLGRYTGTGQTMTGAGPVGTEQGVEWIAGLDTAFAGYEQDLDDDTKKLLMQTIETSWNPDNPSQQLISLNWTEDTEGKQTLLTRWFYIEKDGTIYELTGGVNDFVHNLNFLALYGNEPFKSNEPVTYAANAEPGMKRGGFATVVDLTKQDALLMHYQEIPFWVSKDVSEAKLNAQPRLMQWTPGYAHTEEAGEKGEDGTWIHEITLPGQVLRLKKEGDENNPEGTISDEIFIQDAVYKLRRVKSEKDADEYTLGLGLGSAKTRIGTPEEENDFIGRGGAFVKFERPKWSGGGGAYYEGGKTRLTELALVSESETERRYVENLHRIGATLYGSKEYADRLVIGGLAQGVEQLKQNEGSLEHDVLLGRLVGLLIGAESAGRLDLTRITGLDTIATDYREMGSRISRDSSTASTEIDKFKQKYESSLEHLYDRYSLGVNITKDFSMEFFLVSEEEEADWISQKPQNIYSRMLWTWSSETAGEGFWRIFASVPVRGQTAGSNSQVVGAMGTGVGQDLFDGLFFQRIAVDFGLVAERVDPEGEMTSVADWKYDAGGFVQGALRVFSNIVEDAKKYRIMENQFNEYAGYLARGAFSKVPPEARGAICKHLEEATVGDKIRNGEYSKVPEGANEALSEYLETYSNGKYRQYAVSVKAGEYGNIPADVKELAANYIDGMVPHVSKEVIATIRNGKDAFDEKGMAAVNRTELTLIMDSLYTGWFEPKKEKLQEEFNGHTRLYLAGSAYFLGDTTHWDIGTIYEYIEGLASFRFYAIAAKRGGGEQPEIGTQMRNFGIYSGADVTIKLKEGELTAGAMVNVTEATHGVAASVGYMWDVEGVPFNLTLMGYSRSQELPEYRVPLNLWPSESGMQEFLVMIALTINLGTGNILPVINPAPGIQNSPYP